MKNLIVIPAYNEEEALPTTVASLQNLSGEYEAVIINDGSRDNTAAVAQRLIGESRVPIFLVTLPMNSGIGAAVQTGYRFAAKRGGYRYVIQFDADGQHDAEYIPALVDECEKKGLDLCVGSRFLVPMQGSFRSSASRRIGIRFFARLIGFLAGSSVTDPTSGFRCGGPRAWTRFAQDYPDDYPEPEVLYWCMRNNLKTGEIPVRMHERAGGVSSIQFLRSIYYMVKVSLAILVDRIRKRESI